jgi:release factor glutamine methyltransferase
MHLDLSRRAAVAERLRAAGCVFADAEAGLLVAEAGSATQLGRLVEQRVAGTPLEHLLGWAEFCGRRVEVAAGSFVPRRRSGLLVRRACELVAAGDVLVDLCCGSGAIGLVIAETVRGVDLHAVDIDPAAASVATRNLAPVDGTAYTGDLFAPLPQGLRGRVAVVVANAPYVPTAEIGLLPHEARDHEPAVALDGGRDGVEVHRRIAADVRHWLRPSGWVLLETSRTQAELTDAALTGSGLTTVSWYDDELDATVVGATTP